MGSYLFTVKAIAMSSDPDRRLWSTHSAGPFIQLIKCIFPFISTELRLVLTTLHNHSELPGFYL